MFCQIYIAGVRIFSSAKYFFYSGSYYITVSYTCRYSIKNPPWLYQGGFGVTCGGFEPPSQDKNSCVLAPRRTGWIENVVPDARSFVLNFFLLFEFKLESASPLIIVATTKLAVFDRSAEVFHQLKKFVQCPVRYLQTPGQLVGGSRPLYPYQMIYRF